MINFTVIDKDQIEVHEYTMRQYTDSDCTIEVDGSRVIDGHTIHVQPNSGSTDPGAAVARPGSGVVAELYTYTELAGCTLMRTLESCNKDFIELVKLLHGTENVRIEDSVGRYLTALARCHAA